MKRRTFLVGLGAFAGSAVVVAKAPSIFDMGRSAGVAPTLQDYGSPRDDTAWVQSQIDRGLRIPGDIYTIHAPITLPAGYHFNGNGSVFINKTAGPAIYLPPSGEEKPQGMFIVSGPGAEVRNFTFDSRSGLGYVGADSSDTVEYLRPF